MKLRFNWLLFILSLFIFCEKRDYKNPYDPKGSSKATVPNDLAAIALSDTTIKVQWRYNGDVIGFKIERKDSSIGQFKQLAQIEKDSTSYIDTNLKTDLHYYYQVKAFTASSESFAETDIKHDFPVPSELKAVRISDTLITLTWKDNSIFETGFCVERRQGTEGAFSKIGLLEANVTTFSDSQIGWGAAYFYRVKAFTPHNQSGYSNESNLTPTFPVPTNLNVTQLTDTKVKLEWEDNSSFESGFEIERKDGDSGEYSEIASVGSNVTSYEDNTVQLWETYYYRIRALTTQNISAYSNEKGITLIIPAPSNLIASQLTDTKAKLEWQDNSGFEGGFKVERKIGSSGSYTEITVLAANSTAYINENLQLGVIYFYRVITLFNGEQSEYSNEIGVNMTFPAPSNLQITVLSTQAIRLTWQDNCNFEEGFLIERAEEENGFQEIGQLDANITAYTDNSLPLPEIGRSFKYRLKAITYFNHSDFVEKAIKATPSFSQHTTLSEHSGSVCSVAFSPDGQYFASGSEDSTIRIWHVGDWSNIKTLTQSLFVPKVVFSPDGQYLAAGINNNPIHIWSVGEWNLLKTLLVPPHSETKPVFSPDGQYLAASINSTDRTIRFWDVGSWSEIANVDGSTAAFSPNTQYIAILSKGTIIILRVGEWSQSSILSADNMTSVWGIMAFSPDGQYLLASDDWYDILDIWRVSDWTQFTPISSYALGDGLVFSPDGQYLVSWGDWNLQILHVGDWDQLIMLNNASPSARSAAFSPDMRYLAISYSDGTIRILSGQPEWHWEVKP